MRSDGPRHKTAATSCLQLLSSLASPHKSPPAMAPMVPERLLHASQHRTPRCNTITSCTYIHLHTNCYFSNSSFFAFVERVSCKGRDGVMGIQSNTYARTFNQPSIPCGCRGQHNTQWNFSVSHTTHTKKKHHHVSIMHGITPHVSSESHTRSVIPLILLPTHACHHWFIMRSG